MGNSDGEKCASGHCGHCALGREEERNGQGPAGWRLVVPAIGVFLLPLGLALAGASMVGPAKEQQALGAVVGLLAGFALSVAGYRVARIFGSRKKV